MTDPKDLVRRGYDRASHAYRGDDYPFARSGYAHWIHRLEPHLATGARVLDLGCGNGIPVSRELARRGYDVTGVDLSTVQVERARALVPDARFVCADMASVELAEGSFDAVVAFFSLINLPLDEQPLVIARIARWLVPGGWLLVVTGKWARTEVEPDFRGVPGVPMYWSHADADTYREWLERSGFEIVEAGSEPRDGNPGYAVFLARTHAAPG